MTFNDKKHSIKLVKYSCETCDFICSNKHDYNRHLTTRKHTMMTHDDTQYSKEYMCSCGKKYKYRQGLSVHRKTCNFIEDMEYIEDGATVKTSHDNTYVFQLDKELLIKMLLKNQEVMEKMMEMMPQLGNNSHNTNTNTNNIMTDIEYDEK